jgi:hypothetical protein
MPDFQLQEGHRTHRDLAPPHVSVLSNICSPIPESRGRLIAMRASWIIHFDSMVAAAICVVKMRANYSRFETRN